MLHFPCSPLPGVQMPSTTWPTFADRCLGGTAVQQWWHPVAPWPAMLSGRIQTYPGLITFPRLAVVYSTCFVFSLGHVPGAPGQSLHGQNSTDTGRVPRAVTEYPPGKALLTSWGPLPCATGHHWFWWGSWCWCPHFLSRNWSREIRFSAEP